MPAHDMIGYDRLWSSESEGQFWPRRFSPNAYMYGLGLIVGNQRQADKIIHDILTKVDRNDIGESHYSFIIVRGDIPDWKVLRDHAEMEAAVYGNLIDLGQFFSVKKAAAR